MGLTFIFFLAGIKLAFLLLETHGAEVINFGIPLY